MSHQQIMELRRRSWEPPNCSRGDGSVGDPGTLQQASARAALTSGHPAGVGENRGIARSRKTHTTGPTRAAGEVTLPLQRASEGWCSGLAWLPDADWPCGPPPQACVRSHPRTPRWARAVVPNGPTLHWCLPLLRGRTGPLCGHEGGRDPGHSPAAYVRVNVEQGAPDQVAGRGPEDGRRVEDGWKGSRAVGIGVGQAGPPARRHTTQTPHLTRHLTRHPPPPRGAL